MILIFDLDQFLGDLEQLWLASLSGDQGARLEREHLYFAHSASPQQQGLAPKSPLEALHILFHFKVEKFKCIFGILEGAQPEAAQQKGIPRGIVRR